jgi:hypothetical protein
MVPGLNNFMKANRRRITALANKLKSGHRIYVPTFVPAA